MKTRTRNPIECADCGALLPREALRRARREVISPTYGPIFVDAGPELYCSECADHREDWEATYNR